MRILIVSEDVPYPSMGGLAKHALTLARALVRAGHQVDFMGASLHPIEVAGEEWKFGGRFFAELDGHIAGWKEVALGVFMPPRRSAIARRFARIILRRAADYDAIHYHGHVPNVARYIPRHINFIQTRHDQGSDCLLNTRFVRGNICVETDPRACAGCKTENPNRVQRIVSGAAVRIYRNEVADAFRRHKTIFVSDMLRKNFARSMGQQQWGMTLHNFIDEQRLLQVRRDRSADKNPPGRSKDDAAAGIGKGTVELFVAAKLYPAKGIEALLQELAPRLPAHFRLRIAGDGSDEARLRQAFASERISFVGWCDQQATLAMAAAADAIIVPSVWEEPCATTILEALALGKTTFALARGGTPELARHACGAGQLRLFQELPGLVDALLQFQPHPDYAYPPDAAGGVDRAVRELLDIYRRPPGPLAERTTRTVNESPGPASGQSARPGPASPSIRTQAPLSFSIITCTWNSAAWLPAAIESILMQDHAHVEMIFVDGGSTDDTLAQIKALQRPYRLLENVQGGISRAMNAGIRAASGDVIAHLHSDDYYLAPDVLATVARELQQSNRDWLFGRTMRDLGGKLLPEGYVAPRYSPDRLLRGNFIPHPATFVRRALMQRAGGFDEQLRYAMDYDLWLKLSQMAEPVQMDRALAAFREHSGSLSTRNRLAAMEEDMQVRLSHAGKEPLARLLHHLRHAVRRLRAQAEMRSQTLSHTPNHTAGNPPCTPSKHPSSH
ncbi:MAG: glycosyltransferase [Lacisediminimonas sp.]|nr:glycosyltransferase [Lacisediminimonas sp.]